MRAPCHYNLTVAGLRHNSSPNREDNATRVRAQSHRWGGLLGSGPSGSATSSEASLLNFAADSPAVHTNQVGERAGVGPRTGAERFKAKGKRKKEKGLGHERARSALRQKENEKRVGPRTGGAL